MVRPLFFKYNPNLTDRSSTDLQTVVRDTIKDYNFNNLNKFDKFTDGKTNKRFQDFIIKGEKSVEIVSSSEFQNRQAN